MDYCSLGIGEAGSVITAISIATDQQALTLSCVYDPRNTATPYTLCFERCGDITWQAFDAMPDLQQLDAELIGLSLQTVGDQKQALITTDAFELSLSLWKLFSTAQKRIREARLLLNHPTKPLLGLC